MEDLPEDCNKASDSILFGKNDCWATKAENAKEVTICDNIDSKSAKARCVSRVAVATEDIELCLREGTDDKYCVRLYLENRPEDGRQECEKIPRVDDFISLSDECFTNVAIVSRDVSLCKYTTYQSTCIGKIAKVAGDLSYCEGVYNVEKCVEAAQS